MAFDPDRHHRRSIRWRGYDYTQVGAYHVTICVQDRLSLFGEIVNSDMRPSLAGVVIEQWWHQLAKRFPSVGTDAFIVMPNHIHGIILIEEDSDEKTRSVVEDAALGKGRHGGLPLRNGANPSVGAALRGCPAPPAADLDADQRPAVSLPHIVNWYKSITTNDYMRGVHDLGWPPFRGKLWQRNYFERIIRDDDEFQRTRHYIAENPVNWARDEEIPDGAR